MKGAVKTILFIFLILVVFGVIAGTVAIVLQRQGIDIQAVLGINTTSKQEDKVYTDADKRFALHYPNLVAFTQDGSKFIFSKEGSIEMEAEVVSLDGKSLASKVNEIALGLGFEDSPQYTQIGNRVGLQFRVDKEFYLFFPLDDNSILQLKYDVAHADSGRDLVDSVEFYPD